MNIRVNDLGQVIQTHRNSRGMTMNIEETKKAIEVMQAYVDGKEIQDKSIGDYAYADWLTLQTEPTWDFSSVEYRVKPEPLECWVTVFKDSMISTAHNSKEGALKIANCDKGWTVRKFREVIE